MSEEMYCTVLRKIYAKEYNVTVSSKILQTVNSEGVSSVVKTKTERKNGRIASHGKTRLKVSDCGSVVSILVELTLPFWNLEMLTAYTVDNFTSNLLLFVCFRVKGHPSKSRHVQVLAERGPPQGCAAACLDRMWVSTLHRSFINFKYFMITLSKIIRGNLRETCNF